MKVAIPYWNNRISPVLDTAENFKMVDVEKGKPVKDEFINLGEKSLSDKAEYFKKRHISIILCGAVSEYFHNLILARGIKVVPWLTGDIESVLEAFICNNPFEPGFIMPGCKGCRRRRHRRRRGF